MSKRVRSIALPLALSVVAPGIGTALGSTLSAGALSAIGAGVGSAANNYSSTHNIGSALKSGALGGAGSYVGGQLAGNVLPDMGTVTGGLQSVLGPDLGSAIGQGLGGNIALSPLNAIVGSKVGADLASSLVPQKTKNPTGEGAANSFSPTRQGEKEAPISLRGSGAITPEQYSSGVATQGVYGGGAGPEEQDYFLNLVNRRLVDDAGKVDEDFSDISPIENSYLSQLGLGGMGNPMSLLEAISKRKQAA